MKTLGALWLYATALKRHGVAFLTSSALVAVVGIVEHRFGAPVSWRAYVVLLVLTFLWSSFKAWEEQFKLVLGHEARLRPSLSLYVVDARIRRAREQALRIFVFQLLVSNLSDAVNSLREVRLVIEYSRGQGPLSNVAVPHKLDLAPLLAGVKIPPIQVPHEIAAGTALAGVALFEVPDDLLGDARVEAYSLILVDIFGHETSAEALLLKEEPL
jgi:hypothetical protein